MFFYFMKTIICLTKNKETFLKMKEKLKENNVINNQLLSNIISNESVF